MARLRGSGLGGRFARGAGGALILKAAATGIGFGLQLLLARLLGAESYGVYTYAFSWVTVLVVFGRFGLGNAVVRFVAEYEATEQWASLRALLRRSALWTATISLLVTVAAVLVVRLLEPRLEGDLPAALYAGLLILPFYSLLGVQDATARGFRRPVVSQVPDAIVRPLLMGALLLAGWWWLSTELSAIHAMLALDVAIVVALVLSVVIVRGLVPRSARVVAPDFSRRSEWWGVALSMGLVGGMNILRNRVDILMIGAFLGPEPVGFYAAAARYAELMLFALQAVNAFSGPMIAGLFARGQRAEIQRLVGFAALAISALAVPVGIALLVFGRPLLGLFGREFEVAYDSLVWLTAGQLASALAGSVGLLMTMTGNHRAVARIVGGSAILNVAMNAVLIPRMGIEGAAAATAVTAAASNGAMWLLVWRRLGVDPTLLGLLRRRARRDG